MADFCFTRHFVIFRKLCVKPSELHGYTGSHESSLVDYIISRALA